MVIHVSFLSEGGPPERYVSTFLQIYACFSRCSREKYPAGPVFESCSLSLGRRLGFAGCLLMCCQDSQCINSALNWVPLCSHVWAWVPHCALSYTVSGPGLLAVFLYMLCTYVLGHLVSHPVSGPISCCCLHSLVHPLPHQSH